MIIIPLGNDTRAEVILSVLGQLSDGIWENSNGMNKYWEYADVEGTDLQVDDDSWRSGFRGKTEADVRNWFANKAKQVVKIWAEDYGKDPVAIWKRDNTDEVAYMGHHRLPVEVRDVYECYDYLKQRKGSYDYGYNKPEVVPESEPAAPIAEGGMNPSQQDLEDFFLDASTHIKCGTKYPKGYVKASGYAVGESEQFKLLKIRESAKTMSSDELLTFYTQYVLDANRYPSSNNPTVDILRDEILRRMR